MSKQSGSPQQWERVAAELQAYRDAQREVWGDLDDIQVARYLTGVCSPQERAAVEHVMQSRSDVRDVIDVLRAVEPARRTDAAVQSVSHLISELKAGDHAAAQQLWQAYFERLVRLAREKLQGTPRREADEEDVALSAFDSFCRGAAQGRFPQLADREDLWQLLAVITTRKAIAAGQESAAPSPAVDAKRPGSAVRKRAGMLTCREFSELLLAFVAGELTEEDVQRIKDHLNICPPCVVILNTYRLTIQLTRQLPPSPWTPAREQRLLAALSQQSQFVREKPRLSSALVQHERRQKRGGGSVEGESALFEAAWKTAQSTGQRPRIEDYLGDTDEPERSALVRELIAVEIAYRQGAGEKPRAEEYKSRFPALDVTELANIGAPSSSGGAAAPEYVVGPEPMLDKFAAQFAEECRRLLAGLADEQLRAIALWKMEGYTNEEIAAKLGCVPRTVERKLGMIRSRWQQEIAP
jgi:DNA-directed RNA polymerase specialized sigma24 family protein